MEPLADRLRDEVREEYGRIARAERACCASEAMSGGACCGEESHSGVCCGSGYTADELANVPPRATADLGTGVPVRYADLRPGESVLDLGSGGGLDAFVAARAVGPDGRVVGIDLTPDMVERARVAAHRGELDRSVEFRVGVMERLPFSDETFDAVLSNCAINLSPEKPRVFREAYRVLKRGGRLSIDDVVQERTLEPDETRGVGCVATADLRRTYLTTIRKAGFRRVRVVSERPYLVRDGRAIASAIAVRAEKPRRDPRPAGSRTKKPRPTIPVR